MLREDGVPRAGAGGWGPGPGTRGECHKCGGAGRGRGRSHPDPLLGPARATLRGVRLRGAGNRADYPWPWGPGGPLSSPPRVLLWGLSFRCSMEMPAVGTLKVCVPPLERADDCCVSRGIGERIPWDPSQQLPCFASEPTDTQENCVIFPSVAEIVARTGIGTQGFCPRVAGSLHLVASCTLDTVGPAANAESPLL